MKIKALCLISGGLDSALAAGIVLSQGVEVQGLGFMSAFFSEEKTSRTMEKVCDELGIGLKILDISREHLELIQHPNYGYGKNINPCIDCHIFMLKKAKEYQEKHGFSFVVTGEVLGERPMSQTKQALRIVERDSHLEGGILRPLSALLLEPTIPEEKGWVKRNKLLSISGRSRKPQLELAEKLKLEKFSTPAGGCLLTDPGFARRMKDLLVYGAMTLNDVQLLKLGRHFRLAHSYKLIVSRNHEENIKLLTLAQDEDTLFALRDFPGPISLGRGDWEDDYITQSASLTLRYSRSRDKNLVDVDYWQAQASEKKTITVSAINNENIENWRI